jgi:fumarate hydratase class I
MDFDRILPDTPGCEPELSRKTLMVPEGALSRISAEAFDRLSFTFSREHLDHLVRIATDTVNSDNDRLVASLFLENAVISAQGTFPLCQDTGTAQVFAWKDNAVLTDGDDIADLSRGIEKTWTTRNLRYSTTLPKSLFDEYDPGNNMPAQIQITATRTGTTPAYRFLFCGKGGGSSNKTSLTQATKALLNESAFDAFLRKQIPLLGTAACPPYSIAVVVGGLSPEQNLLALKLATAGYFDRMLDGWDYRVFGTRPLRDTAWESRVLEIAAETGLGAQFGGKALALSARVLRLPRHGASCPVSIGVSCAAHRNLLGYIDESGIWLERTVRDPLSVPGVREALSAEPTVSAEGKTRIDLDEGIPAVRAKLSGLKPGTPVLLTGKILVARDAAHARWRTLIEKGEKLPEYATKYAILYAGPANTPEGRAIGSFGPTTAGRMDDYAEDLMSRGAALVTLAKGNRSEGWRKACAQRGATYLGTPGGIAALIAERHITAGETIDYPDLGMEAVRLVSVRDLPAFVLVNDRGEDFYKCILEESR